MHEIPTIEKLTWKQVREEVTKVTPKFAEVIDEFNPSDDYFFYKAYYPYGAQILNRGMLHLPTSDSRSLPLENACFANIRDDLNYTSVPLGLILKNSCEVYYEKDYKIEPLAFFKPGIILGLWETLETSISHFPRKIWKMSAGARSLFMLPKISDGIAYDRLKKRYNIRFPMPKRLFDQSQIFAEITNNSSWRTEVLYFSKKWIEETDTKKWIKFKCHLLEEAWALSSYNRNEATRAIVWSLFTFHLMEKGVKPKLHLMQILKRIIAICLGGIPGHKPAGSSANAAPINEIQKAYLIDYILHYLPILMQPHYFDFSENEPIYCSLNLPTLMEPEINYHTGNTLLTELKTLKLMWEYFVDAALEGKLLIDDTPLQHIINNVKLEFFHNEKDSSGEIEIASSIPRNDPAMLKVPKEAKKLTFPTSSAFFRGCIRISKIL